jgi:glycosyltransferase involved in cell wall biosynthesis
VRAQIDLLLDLTGLNDQEVTRQALERLFTDADPGCFNLITVLLSPGIRTATLSITPPMRLIPSEEPVRAANEGLREARDNCRHFLILLGVAIPSCNAVVTLIQTFDIDPHLGAAMPRYSDAASGEIFKLSPEHGDSSSAVLPPRVLTEVSEYYITPEFLSACTLIRDMVVSNFDLFDETYETVAGALLRYLCKARRCGFRCVVSNAAVVDTSSYAYSRPVPNAADLKRLRSEYPDVWQADTEFADDSLHAHESLLGKALSSQPPFGRSLLLDIRGLPGYINGTVEAALSICDGLSHITANWEIALWTTPEIADFYNFSQRYPKWEIVSDATDRYFTAALRLLQPWHLSTLIELHNSALFLFCYILDTIALDIIFTAPRHLRDTWQFLSEYADGIVYISQYTRDRFAARFPASKLTPGYVSYLSFHPDDYTPAPIASRSGEPDCFVLLMGNAYDHKYVEPTAELLGAAFPFRRFKAFGITRHRNSLMGPLESGNIPQPEMDRLFAEADLIVLPSLYEGFGLPVIRGLSVGRTVIARASDLLRELAARYRGPGRLLSFNNPAQLVELVGRVLHNEPVNEIGLGSALGAMERPMTWTDVAAGVLRFVEVRLPNIRKSRWQSRETIVRQLRGLST